MNLSFPQLLAGAVGALLIYSAIVGKSPVQALKNGVSKAGPPQRTIGQPVKPTGMQRGVGGGRYAV